MLSLSDSETAFEKFRPWFYAAAIYNFLWGAVNILFPRLYFALINLSPPSHLPIWQVTAMFVLVYAPAYYWAARAPYAHRHLILVGLLGKILGPIGFLYAVLTQQLPLAFGWTIITNDLIWWPVFGSFIFRVAQQQGGLRKLALGE